MNLFDRTKSLLLVLCLAVLSPAVSVANPFAGGDDLGLGGGSGGMSGGDEILDPDQAFVLPGLRMVR